MTPRSEDLYLRRGAGSRIIGARAQAVQASIGNEQFIERRGLFFEDRGSRARGHRSEIALLSLAGYRPILSAPRDAEMAGNHWRLGLSLLAETATTAAADEGEGNFIQPMVLPFQPQLPASTSLKFRKIRFGATPRLSFSNPQIFCASWRFTSGLKPPMLRTSTKAAAPDLPDMSMSLEAAVTITYCSGLPMISAAALER